MERDGVQSDRDCSWIGGTEMSFHLTKDQVLEFDLVHCDLTDLVRSFKGNPPEELRNALQATSRFMERCLAAADLEEAQWQRTL